MKKSVLSHTRCRRASALLCLILALVLLSACASPAPLTAAALPMTGMISIETAASPLDPQTPEPLLSEKGQRRLIEKKSSQWIPSDLSSGDWFYAITDLNANGRLEVITASTQGTGVYTTVNVWEISPSFASLIKCGDDLGEGEAWPEILLDALPCYYDSQRNIRYYVCEDMTRDGASRYYFEYRCFFLLDGVFQLRTLASKDVSYTDLGAQASTVCRDYTGRLITEQEYDNTAARIFSGMEKSSLALNWTRITSAAPAPTPVPTAIPTPAPTPVPTISPSSGPAVRITKNPTSESLSIGGTTWFIAHAQNATALTWQVVSPDGLVYTTAEAQALHAGLVLELLPNDTIAVRNVPLSLNGWGFRARFDGPGGSAVTTAAYIYVGDFVNAYGSVINAYRQAYQGGDHSAQYAYDHDLSEYISSAGHVGYAFKDLNKDGTPELFIAGLDANSFADMVVYDLYTLVDGKPTRLAVSSARNRYYLRNDNGILNEGSGGAGLSFCAVYRFKNNQLNPAEAILCSIQGQANDGYYFQKDGFSITPRKNDQSITQSQYSAKQKEYETAVFMLIMTKIA